ncbi:hypothetical protein Syun_024802 [Stephania yunnanensis]|uniref:Uncharacterized protein n=1 Tax=Stephania yunnanensis TaxID=152371 RepID=A0AAP0EVT1_9MAGN
MGSTIKAKEHGLHQILIVITTRVEETGELETQPLMKFIRVTEIYRLMRARVREVVSRLLNFAGKRRRGRLVVGLAVSYVANDAEPRVRISIK